MEILKTLLIGIAMLVVVPAQTAQACSCSAPATAAEALQRSSAVFHGRVTKLSQPFMDSVGLTSSGRHFVEFKVIKQWKGAASSGFVVKTPLTGEACGFPFEVEKEYLVYVIPDNNVAPTGICTGTKSIAEAAPDIKELDKRAAGIR